MKFTSQQLRDWKAYEWVRSNGRFNMFDPRARRETGLSPGRYSFVMDNYTELKAMIFSPENASQDTAQTK